MATSTKASGLRDYNEVSQRVEGFNAEYADGRIVTSVIELTPDRVAVKAEVYKHRDNPVPDSTGLSFMNIPGSTNVTRGSELENTETSAVGRALAFIGFYAKGESLASKQEIAAKAGQGAGATVRQTRPEGKEEVAGGLTEPERKKLFAALKKNGLEGAPRKALVMMVTKKHSVKQMDSTDLDKVLAVLDDPTDEANEGLIALAKDVETVGAIEDDD